MAKNDFLFELGCEELPPKALKTLARALEQAFIAQLTQEKVAYESITSFATPRRLALLVTGMADTQDDSDAEIWGPPISAAFDREGKPTKAAEGFARKCGVALDTLQTDQQGKATKLVFRATIKGQPTTELLPAIIETSLVSLPIPKRMRWGEKREEFVRPAHWLILLFGEQVIDCQVLGLVANNQSFGHRFHAPEPLTIVHPSDYEVTLEKQGFVVPGFEKRQQMINAAVTREAKALGGEAVVDPSLLEEVTALVEWPVALAGNFEDRFLRVPTQALVSSMKEHQKYFHVVDDRGELLPHFITLANIESKNPQQIIAGNERVIRPRLADAAFFFDSDLKVSLEARLETLKPIVFQQELGSLHNKAERIAALSSDIAKLVTEDEIKAARAGLLAKSDLVSLMVGEFPDLQGTMGRHYALNDGEHPDIAEAIGEQYRPAFAGDSVPQSKLGCCVSLADKLDTMTGLFAIGKPPSGDRDPFAIRRAALGILRMILEQQLPLDLQVLVDLALRQHQHLESDADTSEAVISFMLDRFRTWYHEEGVATEVFNAVHARRPTAPIDFQKRIYAVHEFNQGSAAPSLAAANKRVSNILSKETHTDVNVTIDVELLSEDAEKRLAERLNQVKETVTPLLVSQDYSSALAEMAALREPVDQFFDHVMVMDENPKIRANRVAILYQLRELFLRVADISLLQTSSLNQ